MDLSSKAMIASVSIKGIWGAVAEDEEASREVAQRHNVDPNIGRYLKKILDPKRVPSLKKFNSSRNALRILHRKMTLAWNDRGGRLLPQAVYFDYMAEIGAAKQKVIDDYEAFLAEMPTLKAAVKADPESSGLFRDDDWPDVQTLRDKVNIRVRIEPLADVADFRVQLGATEESKIRESCQKDIYAKLAGGLADLVSKVKETVQDSKRRFEEYATDTDGKVIKTFKDTAVTNLRGIVADARKLNVIGDPTLDLLLKEIDQSLCSKDPQSLRDNFVLRKQAVSDASSIAAKLANIESVLSMQAESA